MLRCIHFWSNKQIKINVKSFLQSHSIKKAQCYKGTISLLTVLTTEEHNRALYLEVI